MWRSSIAVAALLATWSYGASAAEPIAVTSSELKWTDIKEIPGAKQAVLRGDPTKAEEVVSRVKLPPNSTVPAHTHPNEENVTVLEGLINLGIGSAIDKSKGRFLRTGDYFYLPPETPHFAWTGGEGVTIQVQAMGPIGIKFMEPAVGSSTQPAGNR
jgi:quercetin dioxygenase-like cupin family protein